MKKITAWLNDSCYIDPLSPGCEMCAKGSKMVVLVTGLCPANCFYCPLSKEKTGKDRIFADEWELKNEEDTDTLIQEAKNINAKGAGITGGDPLIVWDRTKKYISLLKEKFGKQFHIHLYTSGIKNVEYIEQLVSAGLDEIRFHPPPKYWKKMEETNFSKTIKQTVELNKLDVAIEIPSIPERKKDIISLIRWADEININWINLNELEYSETNAKSLKACGYSVKNDVSSAVYGSQEIAYEIIKKISQENISLGVHYCSSSFKDGIQLRNRIMRRAKNTAKEHETITEDGTITKGIIVSNDSLNKLVKLLCENFGIDERQIYKNQDKNRIELPLDILKKFAEHLKKHGYKCFIVEEYPTADQLEVERIPLT